MLLVAAYGRTNLTMRQIGPLFGVSHSAAHRVIDSLGPLLAVAPVHRRRTDQIAILDGTLVPLRDHRLAAQSKNYRYWATLQVAIDADTRLVIALGTPQPGNRNDCTGPARHSLQDDRRRRTRRELRRWRRAWLLNIYPMPNDAATCGGRIDQSGESLTHSSSPADGLRHSRVGLHGAAT